MSKTERPKVKAQRTLLPLVGTEDVKLVDPNRIYHHGYKYFLSSDKIMEIFGERIARSKKIRKAKIRDILRNVMRTIDVEDGMTVDSFVSKTEQLLRTHIAEIQSMQSSPVENVLTASSPATKPATKQAGKRKEKSKSRSKDKTAENVPMEIYEEKVAINPIQNQLDFITRMLEASGPNRPSNMTMRQVEREFKKAKTKDDIIVKREQIEIEKSEKAAKKQQVRQLKTVIRDELTDMFRQTGL